MSDSGLQACPPPLLGERLYPFPCAGSQSLFSPAFQGPHAASEKSPGIWGWAQALPLMRHLPIDKSSHLSRLSALRCTRKELDSVIQKFFFIS